MSGAPRLLGAVLAGGESRRFGRDKGSALVGGLTLVDRAAGTLSEVFAEVVIVSSQENPGSWRRIADLRPGRGPLAGIETALARAEELGCDGAFVLACDLPLVTAGTVETVALALASGGAAAAAPAREGSPSIEPLCAGYGNPCLKRVRELLDGGESAAHALFDAVAGVSVPLPANEFLNVNTVDDRDRAERELGD